METIPEPVASVQEKKLVTILDLVKQNETIRDAVTYEGGPTLTTYFIDSKDLLDAIHNGSLSEKEIYANLLGQASTIGPLQKRIADEERYIADVKETGKDTTKFAEKNLSKLLAMKEANPKYMPLGDNIEFRISSHDPQALTQQFMTWLKEDERGAAIRTGDNKKFEGDIQEFIGHTDKEYSPHDPSAIDLSLDYASLSHCMNVWGAVRKESDGTYSLGLYFHVHTEYAEEGKVGCIPDFVSLLKLAQRFKEGGLSIQFRPGEWIPESESSSEAEGGAKKSREFVVV